MARCLLSTHSVDGDCSKKMSQEEMMEMWGRIQTLEGEMKSEGALVMSVRLRDAAETKVVRNSDDDAALAWATKVTACIGRPIEVRGFQEHAGS